MSITQQGCLSAQAMLLAGMGNWDVQGTTDTGLSREWLVRDAAEQSVPWLQQHSAGRAHWQVLLCSHGLPAQMVPWWTGILFLTTDAKIRISKM